ncbi:MAG: zinc-dependent metalloprotease family protein, partial [Burkholderiaceae bacterium]
NVATGGSVTINGTGLSEVSAVTVGASAATIVARSDTQLAFSVPAGVNCGPITLLSQSQPSVPAGSVVVGAGCTVRSAGVEFAQVYSQSAGADYQRLVPGKETWVRAYVVAEAAGTAAPVVRLTGFSGTVALGTIAMNGPATLPQLAAGAAVPDSMRYDEALTFNASLPATWVGAGLRVRVEIDPDRRYGDPIVVDAAPNVGSATRIDLVLVPLVSGGNVPQLPAAAAVADEIVRRLPIARENVGVAVRAPYTLTTVTDGVDTSSDWSSALGELETLRRNEARTKHYYGFVRPMVSAGTAGIGYVNRVGSTSPNLSAIGWDASRTSWRRTFSHELGHNFGREHAPCGGPANPDPYYPYPNGALNGTPLFDSLLDDIVAPAGMSDIMGYCSGAWFSDYNFREVQRFVEAQPQPVPSIQSAERVSEVLVVSGSIGLDGVRFNPVQRQRGAAPIGEAGEYTLRLVTAAGAAIEVPFDAVRVDHALPAERHFFVKLPDPGELAEVAVLRGADVLPQAGAGAVRAQGQRAPAPPASARVDWSEDAGALVLAWNAAAHRYLSVTHVAESGERRVLAVLLAGGNARIDVADLARGGEFEFGLSDGLNTRLVVVPR